MGALINGDEAALNQLMMEMAQQQLQAALSNPDTMEAVLQQVETMMSDPETEAMIDQAIDSILARLLEEGGPLEEMLANLVNMGDAEMQQFLQEVAAGAELPGLDMTGLDGEQFSPLVAAMLGGKTPEEFLAELGVEAGKAPQAEMQCSCLQL